MSFLNKIFPKTNTKYYKYFESDIPVEFLNANKKKTMVQNRILFINSILCILTFIIIISLISKTSIFSKNNNKTQIKNKNIITRPDIKDRNGEIIASSNPTLNLYIDATLTINPENSATKLVNLFKDLDYNDVLQKLKSNRKFIYIKRNISLFEKEHINQIGEPAFNFETSKSRFYPNQNLFSHIIGIANIDNKGISGIEKYIDYKKLNNEKEVIGFYISSHPLDIYKDTLNSLNAKNLSDISSINMDTVVSFGCIVERVDERISKAGKQYLSVKVSDQFGIVNVLFFASKKLKPKEQEDYFNNIKSILLSDKPILIESDLKYNSEKNDITLFAKNCQILKFDIQFTGDLNLILSNPDSIIALYKIFESIYEGGTTIYLNVKTNDKFVRIKLLEKKLITPESLLQIKNLNGVVIEFINT